MSTSIEISPRAATERLIDEFISKSDLKPISRAGYRRRLRQFTKWLAGQNVSRLTRNHILEYRAHLNSTLSSPYSVRGYLVAVRSLFNWLEAQEICPNLAKQVRGPKKPKGFRKDPLTVEQVRAVLGAFDKSVPLEAKYLAMMNLMIRTGLRCCEVVRANVGDIQLLSGQYVLWVQGKGSDSKDEFVILTDAALKPIFDYLAGRKNPSQEEPLFVAHPGGGRLSTRTVSRIAKQAFAKIGIVSPRITAHSTRHTMVTLSLMAGNSLMETQKAARHEDISSTLIYSQAIKRLSGNPERKLDSYIDEEAEVFDEKRDGSEK